MDKKFPALAGLIIGAFLCWYADGYYPGFYLSSTIGWGRSQYLNISSFSVPCW